MVRVSILDCTLRDGGYINSWAFGKSAISDIIRNLESSGIDIIECGFIEDKPYDKETSVFNNVNVMSKAFRKKTGTMYVGMIALGDIDASKVVPYRKGYIDGIRLTFHKHEIEEEFVAARVLMNKGYKVFIQPVGTSMYSDEELLNLICKVNEIRPYAFYIVDTLGTMYPQDVSRIFTLVDHNLDNEVRVGFHSHNNLQLSFANAQTFIRSSEKRELIVDSSVFGMGRGAGNLTTELIAQYINDVYGYRYDVTPFLTIMSTYLNEIYMQTPWGYSSPYYLSAINGCHPNYANFLMTRKTLTIEAISKILNLIPRESRGLFDKALIEKIYLEYQSSSVDDKGALESLKKAIRCPKVLVVASGDSVLRCRKEISSWVSSNECLVIHVNSVKKGIPADLLFVSNSLKAGAVRGQKGVDIIFTSNISDDRNLAKYVVNYSSLLGNSGELDNAGLMCVNLLRNVGVKEVVLAGFDGFVFNPQDYLDHVSNSYLQRNYEQRNRDVSSELTKLSHDLNITFITPSLYTKSL